MGRAGAPEIGGVAPGLYVVVSGMGFLVGMPDVIPDSGGTPVYVAKGGGPVGAAGVETVPDDAEVVEGLAGAEEVVPGAAGVLDLGGLGGGGPGREELVGVGFG